jgi:hypothetical protein
MINTCRKVPLQVNFLDDDIYLWGLYCLIVNATTFNRKSFETYVYTIYELTLNLHI